MPEGPGAPAAGVREQDTVQPHLSLPSPSAGGSAPLGQAPGSCAGVLDLCSHPAKPLLKASAVASCSYSTSAFF